MSEGQKLYDKAKKLIPGGTQLLSKRPEMHLPDFWPNYFEKSKGINIWDIDGNEYVDMCYMGIGTNVLGYCDEDIDNVVHDIIRKGNTTTLNSPEEVTLAKLLIDLHPWADMARFTKTGGEAMQVAIRIARAKTKKSKILFCGYHGWHDWYLAANLEQKGALDGHWLPGLDPNGVPKELKGTSLPFKFNDVQGFKTLVNNNKDVGVIAFEIVRDQHPTKEWLQAIREAADENGIIVIIDEITSGFRLNVGGAHLLYDFIPDISVFGKGLSNGYPMAAIIGEESVMQAAQSAFITSTYWTDRIGPAASIACINKMKELNVPEHLIEVGDLVQKGWREASLKSKVDIKISGIAPLGHFGFNYDNALLLKTLYTQEMLKRGFLASTAFYASYAHSKELVKDYVKNIFEVFEIIANAIKNNSELELLEGSVCQSGFKRLT
jgi:glutamate-1-semialdehyde 2,1-aminomutase